MLQAIFWVIIGLALLIAGAEWLVKGSASLAKKWRVSELAIGLTVVALGTSMPELVVNVFAAIRGSADIGIGNVVGSNIANILLILGLAAVIAPLAVKGSTVWKETPFALLAMILIFIMGNDVLFDLAPFNVLTRTDGLALMAFFLIFLTYTFGLKRMEDGEGERIHVYPYFLSIILTISGLVLLFLGGKLLVDNAIIVARLSGLSESLIGLTIVAIGTSLPELATSVIAAIHKHNDIAVGNIVGSNIFNIFWILGLTSIILPLPFNPRVNVDIGVGVVATLLLFGAMFLGKKHKLERWQGALFLLGYIAYITYLILRG